MGQILPETDCLFYRASDRRISVGLSVSRVGIRRQIKAEKQMPVTAPRGSSPVARKLAEFANSGRPLDAKTRSRSDRGSASSRSQEPQ